MPAQMPPGRRRRELVALSGMKKRETGYLEIRMELRCEVRYFHNYGVYHPHDKNLCYVIFLLRSL